MAKREFENLQAFKALEGKPIPTGDWVVVTQEMIDDFARATMDFQWIHVDPEKAAKHSPFGKTVAHGFLSLALLSRLLGEAIRVRSVTMGVNYGLNKVRFPSPVPVDSRIRLTGRVQELEDYRDNGLKITWHCTVEIEGSDKPACVAEFISLMFE
ncbi:MAG: MaoC family dehydratase [Robiginitalea sp.]|nr:MaoC family dehydratase [Robiginitalea sp.]